ncbi:MAG: response regulator, partial [Phycisphaeraceae bacterium]
IFGASDRYEVQTATTGYDAGMLTEQFKPDLILLDYMLPDINGNVVLERIRASDALSHTRIILVSGVVNPSEVDRLLAAGADAFVKKPFDIEELQTRVAELLEQ